MQLSVPRRAVADSKSFPTEPDDVDAWLGGLKPLASDTDARLVHRGLMHSNRLHNDPDRRRAVLAHFLPVLDDLHEQLSKLTRAQPLPLVPAFARAASFLESLLREEAFAFKILLSDRDEPDPEDARLAMRAFARQVDVALQGYRRPPTRLLADAEMLYQFAESAGLLDDSRHDERATTEDFFRFILLSGIIDTARIRASQLPLTLDFLRASLTAIELRSIDTSTARDRFAVVLGEGVAPAPTPSLIVNDPDRVRVFGIDTLLDRIDTEIFRTPTARGNLLGVETLAQQTLERLRTTIGPTVARRSLRVITCIELDASFGHKAITSGFLFGPARNGRQPFDDHRRGKGDPWILVNRSKGGVCLKNSACRSGSVQVGDLVAFDLPAQAADAEPTESIGQVRWLRAEEQGLSIGIEYLAHERIPVSVSLRDAESPFRETGMIIDRDPGNRAESSILLPPYLYRVGEVLSINEIVADADDKSATSTMQEWTLIGCLQTNGLFSHFLLG